MYKNIGNSPIISPIPVNHVTAPILVLPTPPMPAQYRVLESETLYFQNYLRTNPSNQTVISTSGKTLPALSINELCY